MLARLFTSIFLALGTLVCDRCTGADWPTYAHDNQRSGITTEELSPPLNQAWVFEPAFQPARGWPLNVNGYGAWKNAPNVNYDDASQVVAVGSTAYLAASGENCVYAIDAVRGEILWTFRTEAAPRLAPTVSNGRVYFGSDDGRVHCLDAETGAPVWHFNAALGDERLLGHGRYGSLWPVRAGVMIDDGCAWFTAGLFPSEGVFLYCVDAATGKLKFQRSLTGTGNDGPSPQGYPLADSSSIYLTSRLEPTRWRKSDGGPVPFETPRPEVNQSHEYRFYSGGSYAQLWDNRVVFGQAAILGYEPDAVWKDKYGRDQRGTLAFNWFNARRIAFKDDVAFVATDYHIHAVKQKQLPQLAKTICRDFEEAYKKHRVATCVAGLNEANRLGVDTERGKAILNGNLRWSLDPYQKDWPDVSKKLFDRFESQTEWMTELTANEVLVVAGNIIYAGGEDRVVALDSDSGAVRWQAITDSRVRGLAVANGRLFVSSIDGKVRCFHSTAGSDHRVKLTPARVPQQVDEDLTQLADRIVRVTGVRDGYCLISGDSTGQLAEAVAERTNLTIEVVADDHAQLDEVRNRLAIRKLYGGRINIITANDPTRAKLPYPPFNFDLVIDLPSLVGEPSSIARSELERVTRPQGGILLRGSTTSDDPKKHGEHFTTKLEESLIVARRGKEEGTRNWTHNYATAANTYCSEDSVEGPFGILWYGDPGPRKRIDRHSRGPVPLVVDGVALMTGYDLVMAYDIYNGRKLWERWMPGATREDLPTGTSNLAADSNYFYVVRDNTTCLQLDRMTGETRQEFKAPRISEHQYWGWIAVEDGMLLGSLPDHDERRRRASNQVAHGLFAINAETGETAWTYKGTGIEQDGIAVSEGRVYFVDRNLTDAETKLAIETPATGTSAVTRTRQKVDRRGNPILPDVGNLVALKLSDGTIAWKKPFDFTNVTLDDRALGQRSGIICMVKDGVVVVSGIGSIGHPYNEFKKGEFAQRAIYAFNASDGTLRWGGPRNHRKRPIIVGDSIYAEPGAWNLKTGEPRTIVNPLTGKQTPIDFLRGYSGCDHLLASANCIFGNAGSGGFAHYNLDEQAGYTPMGGMQLACNTGAVPANGLFVAPEGRSGCACGFGLQTSLVLYPRNEARAWGFSTRGNSLTDVLPVQHAAVNLGAPGFRTDSSKRLWLPYAGEKNTAGAFRNWLPQYQHRPESFSWRRLDTHLIDDEQIPWVYSSHYHGEKELAFPVSAEGKHQFTIRLYFIEPENKSPGERVFSIMLQGKPVIEEFDIAKEAGGGFRPLTRTFEGIEIDRTLRIQLKPKTGRPILCGFEVTRESR